jgi:hypothetical protein
MYFQGVGAADSSSTGAAGDDGVDAKSRMKEHGKYTPFSSYTTASSLCSAV